MWNFPFTTTCTQHGLDFQAFEISDLWVKDAQPNKKSTKLLNSVDLPLICLASLPERPQKSMKTMDKKHLLPSLQKNPLLQMQKG